MTVATMRREALREALRLSAEMRAILTAAGGVSEECNYRLYHAWRKTLGATRLIEEELGGRKEVDRAA